MPYFSNKAAQESLLGKADSDDATPSAGQDVGVESSQGSDPEPADQTTFSTSSEAPASASGQEKAPPASGSSANVPPAASTSPTDPPAKKKKANKGKVQDEEDVENVRPPPYTPPASISNGKKPKPKAGVVLKEVRQPSSESIPDSE